MNPADCRAASTAAPCSALATAAPPAGASSTEDSRPPATAPAWGTSGRVAPVGRVVAATCRSWSARSGSLKSLVSWICPVTVAPARLSSDNTASRSLGSAAAVVTSTTFVLGSVPRTVSAPTDPANFSSPH